MAFRLRKPPRLVSKHESYPYQLDAVLAVKDLPYAAIFHEQGLGKTKIAIDILLYWLMNDIVDTVFVITKKTLVQNWCNEIDIHSYITPKVLSGNRRSNSVILNSPVLVYVLNYEVIQSNQDIIASFLRTCRVGAILDESQKIKNPESNLTQCFLSMSEMFDRRIIATGTPAANRPYDIWSQVFFLDGGRSLGASFDQFKAEMELPRGSADAGIFGDRLLEAFEKISSFSVRETKQSAGIELPEKLIETNYVSLSKKQQTIYDTYRDELVYEIETEQGLESDSVEVILKRLLRLVQCASNPMLLDKNYCELPAKYLALRELFENINVGSNKVIVWTGFIDNTKWLATKISDLSPEIVHGELSIERRNASIERFKHDASCRVMVATPGAAKEGLTLTVANHVVFFDRSFSLDDYLQAQDRIHRISQKKICYVHNIMARNTIDEWVDALLNAKHQAAQLIQGDISSETFRELFEGNLSGMLTEILSPN